MSSRKIVGMAELAIAKSPDVLETKALGSCVSVALYDAENKIGGLTHAMLPTEKIVKKDLAKNLKKFVDSSIRILISELLKEGAKRDNLQAKLIGGANMFPDIVLDRASIGEKNSQVAITTLAGLGIDLISKDIGGNYGRTVVFDTSSWRIEVKRVGKESNFI